MTSWMLATHASCGGVGVGGGGGGQHSGANDVCQ